MKVSGMTREERYIAIHNKYVREYKAAKKKGFKHVADWYKDLIVGYRGLIEAEKRKKK